MGDAHDGVSIDSNIGKDTASISPPLGDSESDGTIQSPGRGEEDRKSIAISSLVPQSPRASASTENEYRPPLPPRPINLDLLQENRPKSGSSLRIPKRPARPQLQSTPTTAVSRTDIQTQSRQDGSRETSVSSTQLSAPPKAGLGFGSLRGFRGIVSSRESDSASITSCAPTLEAGGDVESLLGEVLDPASKSPAWNMFGPRVETSNPFDAMTTEDSGIDADFYREFDEIREAGAEGGDEGNSCNMDYIGAC